MTDVKPMCKFGAGCYRKNPQHLKQYRHPKRKLDEEDEGSTKKVKKEAGGMKGKTITDFFGKPKHTKEHDISSDEDTPPPGASTSEDKHSDNESVSSREAARGRLSESEEEIEDVEEEDTPDSPVDIKENIQQKFLVEMPEDFYQFWEFCAAEKPGNPSEALASTLGFHLVGPFDILAGKHKGVSRNKSGKRPNYLLHWRYFYDPPEFQTVIRGDDKAQFHIGYFRDDPKENPAFVAANSAKTNCHISPKGDNLFAAVSFYVEEKIKSKDSDSRLTEKCRELLQRLKDCAKKNNQCLDMKSKSMKDRDKKVVCKSFHGAGIVVPVDEYEVGYREVPETPGDLKKMFKKIVDSTSESERDKNFEPLQELITLVQFANDECDYGEGLELGMDLFCYGERALRSTVLQLLPMAYMLLGRTEFQKIIEAHMKNRRHDTSLSQLD